MLNSEDFGREVASEVKFVIISLLGGRVEIEHGVHSVDACFDPAILTERLCD